MDRQARIDFILDHYEHPRNKRPMAAADLVGIGGNPGCGDEVTVFARVDDLGQLTEVSFTGEGCTVSQAAASLITEQLPGRTVSEVREMGFELISESFGDDIVRTRQRCATLALSVLKGAITEKYRWER